MLAHFLETLRIVQFAQTSRKKERNKKKTCFILTFNYFQGKVPCKTPCIKMSILYTSTALAVRAFSWVGILIEMCIFSVTFLKPFYHLTLYLKNECSDL